MITLKELLEMVENKKQEAGDFFARGEVVEGNRATKEFVELKEQYDNRKALEEAKIENLGTNGTVVHDGATQKGDDEDRTAFFNALRTKKAIDANNAAISGDNEAGGYTVPEDIQTSINEFREARDVLTELVTVEPVTTPTGARTFKQRSQQEGFVEVDEMGEIPEKATPKFKRLVYAIKKYAGFLPASNELLADSDAAIASVLISWLGNDSRVTRNKLVLGVLGGKSKTEITSIDDVKKAVNVTLDPAFRNTTTFVTNQDGFNWLDTLKDEKGNYLLQETIAFRSGRQLLGRQVVVISNKDLPSVDGKAPLIIGDLKEAVVLFDRKRLGVRVSDVAGDAFLTDSTLFRAIERLDVKMRDDEAFVYGQIDVTPTV